MLSIALMSGLKRNRHAFPLNNSRSFSLYRDMSALQFICSLAVNRMPESVNNAAQAKPPLQALILPGRFCGLSLPSLISFLSDKYGNRNGFVFKILSHSEAAVIKFEQLACHAVAKAIHTRNAITNKNHISCLRTSRFLLR